MRTGSSRHSASRPWRPALPPTSMCPGCRVRQVGQRWRRRAPFHPPRTQCRTSRRRLAGDADGVRPRTHWPRLDRMARFQDSCACGTAALVVIAIGLPLLRRSLRMCGCVHFIRSPLGRAKERPLVLRTSGQTKLGLFPGCILAFQIFFPKICQ